MKIKSQTETTFETHEIWVIRRSRRKTALWCSQCADHTQRLTPEEAAKLMNVSTRTIYRWTEAGRIHFTESSLLFLYKSSTAVKSKQQRHLYEFGPFSLDTTDRFLLRAGQPVSLPPKARSLVGSLNEGDTDAPCRLLENFVINGECRPRRLPKLV